MEMNINSNMHPLGFASNYINYNQLLQDSSLYEEDEEYIRSQFHTDDVLEDQEEFEDMYAEEPQEENRASEPDSESKTKRQTVEEFFRCMICYEKANKPLMCPHCSKFCCSKCFKKWLNEHNGTCPCCRRPIDSKNLVKVRFMSELSDVSFAITRLSIIYCLKAEPQQKASRTRQAFARNTNKTSSISASSARYRFVRTARCSVLTTRVTNSTI